MKRKLNNHGFTVIELIVTLAITSVITSAIYFFLMTNMKIFGTGTSITNVQYQGQYALEELTKVILPSNGVQDVQGANGVAIPASITNAISVQHFTVVYPLGISSTPGVNETHVIELDRDELKIDNRLLVADVVSIKIQPIGQDNFMNCSRIDLQITIKNEDTSITVDKNIKLRNN